MFSLRLGVLYHLKGCMQFGDHLSFHYEFTRQSGQLYVAEQDQKGTGEKSAEQDQKETGEKSVPNVIVFTGIGLKEDTLKSWLQECQYEVSEFVLRPFTYCHSHVGNYSATRADKI